METGLFFFDTLQVRLVHADLLVLVDYTAPRFGCLSLLVRGSHQFSEKSVFRLNLLDKSIKKSPTFRVVFRENGSVERRAESPMIFDSQEVQGPDSRAEYERDFEHDQVVVLPGHRGRKHAQVVWGFISRVDQVKGHERRHD